MNYRQLLLALVIALSLLVNNRFPALLIGSGASGVATAAYGSRELKSIEKISLHRAWEASQKAMKDLGFTITKEEKDPSDSWVQLTALGAGDRIIKVRLIKQSDNLTEIWIHIGPLGSKSLSVWILAKIREYF